MASPSPWKTFRDDLEEGKAEAADGRLDWAIIAFTEAIHTLDREVLCRKSRVEPTIDAYREAHFERGLAYLKSDKHEQAIDDFSAVIATVRQAPSTKRALPFIVGAYLHRGILYNERGDWQRARADFDEVIRRDPLNFKAFYQRGLVHRCLRDREMHEEDFRKARLLDPERFEILEPFYLALPDCNEHVTLPDTRLRKTICDG